MGGGECEKKAGRKYKKERKIKKQIITKSQFRQREEEKKTITKLRAGKKLTFSGET